MTAGKKTSSKKTAEIINKKIENPDASLRDLSKQTGINHETIRRILAEDLSEVLTSSDTIKKMVEQNNLLLLLSGDQLLKDLMNNSELRTDERVRIKDLALKQNKLIEATSEGDKDIVVKFEI